MKEEPWQLRYDPRVRKFLEKLRNKEIVRRIEESALRLRQRHDLGEPLEEYKAEKVRSYRVGTPSGEYRIIYQLRQAERTVFVLLVGPRQEVYKLLKRKRR